jgi:peptidyl-tRNA hydrolase, PTH1 family
MKLIIGLGNPEARYRDTRHNIGFCILTTFAEQHGVDFTLQTRFKACIAELRDSEGERIILAKPTTYYNLVGESYHALSDFYKIDASDTLVVHDELALPFGTIRTRIGGSDAGNNGIKSINQHGGSATHRLRIGTSNDQRATIPDEGFVLRCFTPQELSELSSHVLGAAHQYLGQFVDGSLSHTTSSHTPNRPVA